MLRAKQVCVENKIDCYFKEVDGYLFPHDDSPEAFRKLDVELLAAKDAKVAGVERVNLGAVCLLPAACFEPVCCCGQVTSCQSCKVG